MARRLGVEERIKLSVSGDINEEANDHPFFAYFSRLACLDFHPYFKLLKPLSLVQATAPHKRILLFLSSILQSL